jgi:hypothetical protein
MIKTLPRLRITRQRSHIGLTDVRTFIGSQLWGRIDHFIEKAHKPHESGERAQTIGLTADRKE